MTLRVAHLLDGRHFGGAEQMVRRLALASPAHGIAAQVFLLSAGRLADFLREGGVPFEVIPSSGRFDLRPVGALARALSRDGVQILQAHTSRAHLIARLVSRRIGIPNITTIHSPIALDENLGLRRHPLRAWIERAGRRWTDHVCPVSAEETERLIREEGVPRPKITHIPNGVESVGSDAIRCGTSSVFTIVMIAQLRPRKGAAVLIRAFARFIRGGGTGRLLLIGDDEFTRSGPAGAGHMAELQSLAASEGIPPESGAVEFTGFLADPWTRAAEADLVALPSLFGEGLPLSLIEAMNHGIPILASDVPGNRECVANGVTGWLHPTGDDAALADQIRTAAARRGELPEMGLRAREVFLKRYALGPVMEAWRMLYERLAAGQKKDR